MKKEVTILTGEPAIEVIAEMQLIEDGVVGMAEWVKAHRPECLPDEWDGTDTSIWDLFPHPDWGGKNKVSDNELLVELAGRKCYDSFGLKAGRKSNAEYIANTQSGEIPHRSIMYHAKMTFFIAGVSRRVSQEMMRNYIGADRDEEGSPSQESTRYTHHYGFYVAHPALLDAGMEDELSRWGVDIQQAHDNYTAYIDRRFAFFEAAHGKSPTGMDRKRVYESAIGRLPWEFETSWIWTTNPVAIAKFVQERQDISADREMQRFAKKWKRVCVERWPNLFPQPWMKVT